MIVWFGLMVFNATFNNISVIQLALSFNGGGNRRIWRKHAPTGRKSLTNCIALIGILTHNISGDRH